MEKCEFEYLGPYQIDGVLGRGGMGTVYKGRHSKTGDAVAIKVIATGIANQMRFRRRFAAEVETLKRLRHPNIVQLIGYGEEQGLLFYSMEYVDGHSLHDHLRQYRKLDWSEVIQVGVQVTAALKHAHDLGIIHRDLKPANLMLTNDGHIKLTDFGIAKLFGSTDMTAVGSVIGTADFMPPEQAEGKSVTVRSDLYSLGSVMYALLSGRAPFAGKSVPEVLYAVRYTPPPESTAFAPDAPEELHGLIREMLEKDPLKRPPTALVIGNRLKAIQQGLLKLEADRARTAVPPDEAIDVQVIGKELTSIDLNDDEDNELRVTGPNATHERPTAVASESSLKRLARPSDATRAPVAASSLSVEIANTVDSLPVISHVSEDQPMTSSVSHFTSVSEADTKKFTLGSDESTDSSGLDWVQYASLAGLILLLISAVGVGVWMMQPLSADDLYVDIAAAIESGDDARLVEAEQSFEEFVTRFPDDARSAEVRQWLDEIDLLRTSRILARRANKSGADEMSAIEQGFLECMQARARDPQEAHVKLDAFLAVYGALAELSPKERRYINLAEYAARSLSDAKAAKTPAASAQLEKLIRDAEAGLPREKLVNFYRSLIVLYGDKPWAKDPLNRIRKLNP